MRDMNVDDLVETLAAIEHERWSDWQRYLHGRCERRPDGTMLIPSGLVKRWDSQIATRYEGLTESEKESDRREVRRGLPAILAFARREWLPISRLSEFERPGQGVVVAPGTYMTFHARWNNDYWESERYCDSSSEIKDDDPDAVFFPIPERP